MESCNETSVQVPSLVTTEKINHKILGFNAIKGIVRNNKDLEFVFDLFWVVDNQVSKNNIQVVIGYIEAEKFTVKVKGKDFFLPPEKLMQVSCKSGVGKVKSTRPMLFHGDGREIIEGVECAESVKYSKPVIKNYFKVLVMNDSKHSVGTQNTKI